MLGQKSFQVRSEIREYVFFWEEEIQRLHRVINNVPIGEVVEKRLRKGIEGRVTVKDAPLGFFGFVGFLKSFLVQQGTNLS
jgi:hypothetical protein